MAKLSVRLLICALLVAALPATAQDLSDRTANKPNPDAPQALGDFSRFIGTWEIDSVWKTAGGGTMNVKGLWTFRYYLWGMGIADDFVASTPDGRKFYGTTYRIYNPASNKWEMRYVSGQPLYWMHIEGPHQPGNEMHFEATVERPGQSPWMSKIFFTEITADSFKWHSHASPDGGKTWIENNVKINAKRVK